MQQTAFLDAFFVGTLRILCNGLALDFDTSTLCMLLLLLSADFFQNYFTFQQILSGTLSECQTDGILERSDSPQVLVVIELMLHTKRKIVKIC